MKSKWIGLAVLWPWLKYRFAGRKMTPRFDAQGRIYMLLCDDVQPSAEVKHD